jgi:hypothetical protein
MLTEGIAERIEGADGTVEYAETLRILAPERMISYDETDVSLDTTVGSKAKKLRTIRAGKGDKGQVNATKSSTHITGVGGRVGFKALAAYFVYATGKTLREEWVRDSPVGNVILGVTSEFEENGELVTRDVLALYDCNEKGSMDGAKCTMYTEHIVIPSARKSFPGLANETGRRVIEFCDGVQVHLTWERIKACRAAGVICVLRVPHTTHETQGEDTVIFGPFKTDYQANKSAVMLDKTVRGEPSQLTLADFSACIKKPWEKAFSEEKIKQALRRDGLIPFNRQCYWNLLIAESRRRQAEGAGECEGRREERRTRHAFEHAGRAAPAASSGGPARRLRRFAVGLRRRRRR